MHQEARRFDGDSARPMLHTQFYLAVWGQDKCSLQNILAHVAYYYERLAIHQSPLQQSPHFIYSPHVSSVAYPYA